MTKKIFNDVLAGKLAHFVSLSERNRFILVKLTLVTDLSRARVDVILCKSLNVNVEYQL